MSIILNDELPICLRACKDHSVNIGLDGECSECDTKAPSDTYNKFGLSIFVDDCDGDIKTMKGLSGALPQSYKDADPQLVSSMLDSKQITTHCARGCRCRSAEPPQLSWRMKLRL